MHPRRQATYRGMLIGISLFLLFLAPSVSMAAPTSKSQLLKKKSNINSKISNVRKELRRIKAQESQTKRKLDGVERRLRAARGQLKVASLRLERAKIELQRANLALEEAQEQYAEGQENVGNRLVTIYERGDQGYLGLLLSSDDFGEFLMRSQMIKLIKEQDQRMLNELKDRKDKMEQYRLRVTEKTKEVSSWQQQVAVLHNRTHSEQKNVSKGFNQIHRTRASFEAELAALERDSRAVESMLWKLQNSTAGRARYNRSYSGPVNGMPVAGRIGSGFGYRIHPIYKTKKLHTGVDIGAAHGTRIYSTGGGEVIYAGWRGGYGKAVMIDHGRGKVTLYAHMSSISVRVGQTVGKRQVIGRVGSTGVSTGPHVHYEVRINGRPVNPLNYR